ncbi:alpha-galactosidase [Sporolactobacillus spathodeae]|uniref:Alpha-galactosidase n=1 Tax=Sporolactobacillus spathodeae TaxID=1465502 RepID=A0ABS2Q558_9BACL|nr:alpha-galactosidase [Sporolactobacillus spathodeae]
MISYDGTDHLFQFTTCGMSYCFALKEGFPLHLYWGTAIKNYKGSRSVIPGPRSFAPYADPKKRYFSPDTLPFEYPGYGTGDFRNPAYQIQLKNGSTVTDLHYESHRIYKGKKRLKGLPATYVMDDQEADSLDLTLVDTITDLRVVLTYTLFRDYPVITRSACFENHGCQPLRILRAFSMALDFSDDRFDLINFYGNHNNERQFARHPLSMVRTVIDSARGASSPQHDPFFILARPGTDEKSGSAYGFSLVYSGNFSAQIEVDQYHTTRATLGINPFDFSWKLDPGSSFQTPEVVMAYSSKGLGSLSQTYHQLYRERLARGQFRDRLRPILINNWEATYFKLSEEKLLAIARVAARVGIELFVLDDGWFGHRDNDRSSLGDWIVDRRKLPHGLDWLSQQVHQLGLGFGLWFEPEMVSPDSTLYRTHPDWCLHVPGRTRSLVRNQLVLDLSRADVRNYLFQALCNVLSNANINYIKWDMNRHMTEIGSALLPADRQRETAHRYMLGLYELLEKLTTTYPEVLFESCSSGGGRFDPGMLYYMPQTWTSDNTDAVCRLKIQYGTSFIYPAIAMGAHVSASPNHQVGRVTSLAIRGHVAMSGNFGYELDLAELSEDEEKIIRRQIAFYKQIRPIVQFGRFYRIENPFTGNTAAWCFVNSTRTEAIGFFFIVLTDPSRTMHCFQFRGLDPNALYKNIATGDVFGGDELMYSGLTVPDVKGDFRSFVWRIQKISK